MTPFELIVIFAQEGGLGSPFLKPQKGPTAMDPGVAGGTQTPTRGLNGNLCFKVCPSRLPSEATSRVERTCDFRVPHIMSRLL